jgi:TetR/AcrR family transcriptional regulator, repressor of fatR-cypB operon
MNIHSYMTAVNPDSILQAALGLFVEFGFHGTAVPLVAERAGVGAGTIYRHFGNKEGLVNALYVKWKGEIARHVMQDFPSEQPAREQFRQVWRRMAEFALEHRREFAFLELHHHASYLNQASRAIESRVVEFATLMIERAQAAQVIRKLPPKVLMLLVNGAFIGVFKGGMEGQIPFTLETFLSAEQCCWEAIRT